MKSMLQSAKYHGRLRRLTSLRPASESGVLWAIVDGVLTPVGRAGTRDVILVPSEHLLLLAADLPLPSRRSRLQALPFAIEDRIADAPEAVHLALGAEISQNHYIAAVVRHEYMVEWIMAAEAAGLDHAALMPDALLLPMPGPGHWSVKIAADRAIVRTDDGAGFALPTTQLLAVWNAGGRPACVAYGDNLPAEMTPVPPEYVAVDVEAAGLAAPLLDLRQGRYSRRREALSPLGRRIAIIAAAGLAAHGAIGIIDTILLRDIADRRARETRMLIEAAAPGTYVGDDVASAAANLLPAAQNAPPGRFFPLMTRISSALAPLGPTLSISGITFGEIDGVLRIELADADAAILRTARAALAAAGIAARVSGSGLAVQAAGANLS
jgi:general secretion pathway protein L